MIDLPIKRQGSWFTFSSELGGVTYGFEFRWNEREECWYVTLRDGEGNPIVSGRKVVLGPLFRASRYRTGVMLDADVWVLDTSQTEGGLLDPGYDDLGNRVVLTYATDAELGITARSTTPPNVGNL